MFQKKAAITIAIISLYSSAFAAGSYVSNDLFTYSHSGPSSKYKIVGTVNAGQKIQVLNTNKSTGYTQIKNAKGSIVWIQSKYVSNQPGLKKQLETLNVKHSQLDEKLRNFEANANRNKSDLEKDLDSNIEKVAELEKTNEAINKRLKDIEEENESLNALLDNEKNELLMKWFSYGGMVAGGGLLLGLILPSLIPSRKRKSRF